MNLGKFNRMAIAVYLIVFAVYNLLIFFIFNHLNAVFWVSYLFFLVAFALHMVCVFYTSRKRDVKAVFYGIPLISLSNYFVLAELFASFVFMIFRHNASMKLCVAIQVILLALYLIVAIVSMGSKTYVSKVSETVERDQKYIQNIRGELQSLMQQCRHAEAKETLRKASEAARYADQRSHRSVSEIDIRLENTLQEIRSTYETGDLAGLDRKCTELINLFSERNRVLEINA